MSSGPSIIGLSSSTSQQEEKCYHIATTITNPCYFPVVIVPVLVLFSDQLSSEVSKPNDTPILNQLTSISHQVIQQLTLVVLKHVDTLSSKTRSALIQNPITIIGLSFLASTFADLCDPGHPCSSPAFICMQTSLATQLVLPSPLLPHTTHSHFIISMSKEAISTVFANLLISSMRKWWRHHQPCIYGITRHNSKLQLNPQKHWTLHLYSYSGHQ